MGRPQRSNFDFLFSISSPIIDYSNRSLRIRYNRQQHFNNAQLSSAITVNLNSKVELHLKLITEKKLDLVRERDLETLAVLDDHGLLIGPGETVEQFADRLQLLSANINQFKSEILESGAIDIFDTHLEKAGAIPTKDFKPALEKTRDLYDFEIDWVPGFYTNDRMGVLFAGCAFYSTDDYFALFVVRKAFEKNERWLIYSRTELLAHELCHIAHMGFGSVTYEEMFAYQTSPSRFRRVVGGVFRTPLDSYLILGSVMLLAAAQVVNRFVGEMIPLTKPPIVFFVFALFSKKKSYAPSCSAAATMRSLRSRIRLHRMHFAPGCRTLPLQISAGRLFYRSTRFRGWLMMIDDVIELLKMDRRIA
jgi:hypothetical protein